MIAAFINDMAHKHWLGTDILAEIPDTTIGKMPNHMSAAVIGA
jgi:hypothetical protein